MFSLTEEQKFIQKTAADFAAKVLKSRAKELDEKEVFPVNEIKQLASLGFMGMTIPEEYGGSNADSVALSLSTMEIAKVCASTAITMCVTNMAAEILYRFGNEKQRRKYLKRLCSGEGISGSFAITESSAGSDVASIKTSGKKVDGGYILNGAKLFITSGEYSCVNIVFAVTDNTADKKNKLSAFIVEKGMNGFTIGKREEKLGVRGSNSVEEIFEDCFVPDENLLSKEGEGFKIAMTALDGGRINVASQSVGVALGALEEAVAYSKERVQFGAPISSFQAIKWMLADMATEIDAARLLTLRAAYLKDNKLPFSKEASMAKYYASETAVKASIKAVQVFGGYGYTKEYPVERIMRDARVLTIYEGTSEVQKMVIARHIFK